jgi:hypothetical protein
MKAGLSAPFKGGKGELLGMLGIGAGIGIATVAIGKIVDVMGDAVHAALEEEKSIAKLDAALRANVEGWDGNTDAIEKTLKARMRLGFADDEQRESLALIVGATKDYTKALKIQRVAMDLARLKNISLQAASEALIKVEGGQFRILKTLGIQLPKNATETEALAAVQKLATGQAEAFANTSEGKVLASQVRVGEALETLGGRIMPLFVAGVEAGAEIVESFALALDALSGKFPETTSESVDFIETMLQFSPLKDLVHRSLEGVQADLDETAREGKRGLGVVEASAETLETKFVELETQTAITTQKMRDGIRDLESAFLASAKAIIGDYYDPIEQRAELLALQTEETELRRVLASKNSTKEQIADAKKRLLEIERASTELLVTLGSTGKATQKEISAAITTWQAKAREAKGQAKADILAIIRQLALLKLAAMQASGALNFGGIANSGRGRASGGPVTAGQPYVVGENRPELFVPRVDGTIIPQAPANWQGQSSSGTNNITVNNPEPRAAEQDIGRMLRRLESLGIG